jgi:multidrug efflux pump
MTMNMIVLFSLILALGMLVDNAIVVVENIYRTRSRGTTTSRRPAGDGRGGDADHRLDADHARRVRAAAAFWPGIVGEFMGYLPLTLIITLSSSLFVALVIVPVLAALFIRVDGAPASR